MHQGRFVFSQLTDFISRQQFDLCVERYDGHYYVKHLSCWDHFLALLFGQLAERPSLRNTVLCLNAHQDKLYHLGFRSTRLVASSLSRASEKRDWRIYRDLAQILITKARHLYIGQPSKTPLPESTVYLLDASTIDLCLSLFSWAHFRKAKAGIKLNVLLELSALLPVLFVVTPALDHEVKLLDELSIEVGAYYVMDRGYADYARLHRIAQKGAFFIIRAKKNMAWKRLYSKPIGKTHGLRCDQTIRFTGYVARQRYPDKLRRIKYYDEETGKHYVFLTNDSDIEAQLIPDLYKHRWQIELFFKWIKQHLKIQVFWGYSYNAVMMQVSVAICTYVLVSIVKKELDIDADSYEILQILGVSLLTKDRISALFLQNDKSISDIDKPEPLLLLGF